MYRWLVHAFKPLFRHRFCYTRRAHYYDIISTFLLHEKSMRLFTMPDYYGAILNVSSKLSLSSLHEKIHDCSYNGLCWIHYQVGFLQFLTTCMHLWHYVSHDMVMRPLVAVASIQSHAFHSCMHVCTALYMIELILNFVRLSWIHTREVNYLNFMGM